MSAVGQTGDEAHGILLVKHIALAAAHDQGRAGDAGEAVGEPGTLGAMRLMIEPLEAAAVVFPLPAAVRLLPQIVHQAAAPGARSR